MKTFKQVVITLFFIASIEVIVNINKYLYLVIDEPRFSETSGLIPGQYLVTLKTDMVTSSSVSAIATEIASRFGATVLDTYDTGSLKGFAIKFPIREVNDALSVLSSDARIAAVEQDRIWTVDD